VIFSTFLLNFMVFLPQNHIIMLFDGLGNIIKERRKELRITQRVLAELARVSVNTITKIERGEANPSLRLLEKISNILGMEFRLEVKKK
jgi:transcriptional regulator with XRE-family HTH domain